MSVPNVKESKRHKATAVVLSGLAVLFLLFATMAFLGSLYSWCIIFLVVAMVFCNNAFSNFEKAAELEPESPIVPSLEYFSVSLRSGTPCTILLDLQYPTEDHTKHVMERIRARIQRILNIQLSDIDELPIKPYPFVDELLQRQQKAIALELGLSQLQLKAVDIKTTAQESSPGVFLREI